MKLTKKMIIAGAGVVGAVGIGSAAFAFFSTNGSGTGSANVTNTLKGISFTRFTLATELIPGEATNVGTIEAVNDNSVKIKLGPLSIAGVVVTKGGATLDPLVCKVTPTNEPPAATHLLDPGSNDAATTLSLKLEDVAGVNQNTCLGATVTFTVAGSTTTP